MFPIEGSLVVDATRHHAHSALPDAPVVPDQEKPPKTHRTRQTLARRLRALADRLEPALQPRTR